MSALLPSVRRRSSPRTTVAFAAVMITLAASGCIPEASGDDADTPEPVEARPPVSVTVPPSRLIPFCQAMIDLNTRLLTDPPDDERAVIIETYRSIADQAPPEISEDFGAVLAALESGASPPTDPPSTDPPSTAVPGGGAPEYDEGYGPGGSPAERIGNYVALSCRDTGNNPGPAATEPLSEPSDGVTDG